MAKAEISPGACGFNTVVIAKREGALCRLSIESDCEAIRKLATELTQVEPFHEISFRGAVPRSLQAGARYCAHAACPVPVGIIKAVEVEAGLNLPVDAAIKLSK